MHPTIKFTMTHTTPKTLNENDKGYSCERIEAIPFLDTLCEIKEGIITTDLYRKPSDRNQYLLPSSCHPIECTNSIPFSLGMRINRTCSENIARENRFKELKEMLLEREYTPGVIDGAIARARAIPREEALKCVLRQDTTNRPTFVASFDPRLPSLPHITNKHWRSMVSQDKHLENIFPQPPLVAFKRQKNIRETLVKAKVAPLNTREKQSVNGMKKCGHCIICSYISEGNVIKGENFIWKINKKVNCNDSNIIYLTQCQKERCQQSKLDLQHNSLEIECANI